MNVNVVWRSIFLYRVTGVADFYMIIPIHYIQYLKSKLDIDAFSVTLNKINNEKIGAEYFLEFVAQVKDINKII